MLTSIITAQHTRTTSISKSTHLSTLPQWVTSDREFQGIELADHGTEHLSFNFLLSTFEQPAVLLFSTPYQYASLNSCSNTW